MTTHPRPATLSPRPLSSWCLIALLMAMTGIGAAPGLASAQPTGSITGTVTDAATSALLPNVTVKCYNASAAEVGSMVTDASGEYTIAELPDGTYYLVTVNGLGYADELYDGLACLNATCPVTGGTGVIVTGGASTSHVNFSLALGGRVSGRVTDAATGSPITNTAWVDFFDSTGRFVGNGGWPDSDGNYITAALWPGSYFAKTNNNGNYLNEVYDNLSCNGGWCPALTTGTAVDVTVGVTSSGINFALVVGGSITGTVTAAGSGTPLENVTVLAYDATGREVARTATSGSGAYTLSGLAAGTFFLRTSNSLAYVDELHSDLPCVFGGCTVTTGAGVSVTAGASTSGIDFALALGGTVAGRITDTATGDGLASAAVIFKNPAGTNLWWFGTDAAGYYSARGVPVGSYYVVTPDAPGHIGKIYNDQPWPLDISSIDAGTLVPVTAGATTPDINFSLLRGGSVSGQVVDEDGGAPIAGIHVVLISANGAGLIWSTTDAAGHYTLERGAPDGTYYIRTANKDGWTGPSGYLDEVYPDVPCPYHCAGSLGAPIVIANGQDVTDINFAIRHGARVGGRITSSTTGLGIANVRVELYSATATYFTNGYSDYTVSDAAGNWLMPWAYPTGTYFAKTVNAPGHFNELYDNIPCNTSCDARTGTPIALTMGATTGGIDFALDTAGSITGTVTSSGAAAPLSGVTVYVYNSSGSSVGSATTDASGVYTKGGLATGTYYVKTSNSLGYIDEVYNNLPCNGGSCPSVTTGAAVGVTAGATASGIDFTLVLGGSISGTVTAVGPGTPLSGVYVYVYDASGSSVGSATTDASGVYTKGGLATGTYYVKTSNSLGYIDEVYNNLPCNGSACPSVTTGTGVTVTLGAATGGIDFSLAVGGSITGTLTAAGSGTPLSGVRVYVYNSSGSYVGGPRTNSSGVYIGSGLTTGTYYVSTYNSLGYVDELYNDIPCLGGSCPSVTSGTPVSVTTGATTADINISLALSGSITGTVTAAGSGTPLSGVSVYIYNASGASLGYVSTNASGVYAKTGLVAGTYYARTSNSLGYLNELYDGLLCGGGVCTVTTGTGVVVSAGATASGIDFGLIRIGGGDFTGDFKSDILWRHASGGDIWLWPMDGTTRSSESFVRTIADTTWEIRGLGDQNGDGAADILWRNSVSGQIYWWPMDGSTPLDEIYVGTVDPAYDIVGAGDFDGDGKSDILWRHTTNGDVWIWLMDGATPLSQVFIDRVDPAYVVKGVGDLDADTKADIVWHHATTGEVWVWPMNGTTRLDQVWVGSVPDTGYQIQAVADFTGDRKADLLWWHTTLGEVWIWTMNGSTRTAETWVATIPDTDYSIVAAGDYNGDAKADILWHHATRGEVWVWLMDGTTPISQTWVATVPDTGYRIIK